MFTIDERIPNCFFRETRTQKFQTVHVRCPRVMTPSLDLSILDPNEEKSNSSNSSKSTQQGNEEQSGHSEIDDELSHRSHHSQLNGSHDSEVLDELSQSIDVDSLSTLSSLSEAISIDSSRQFVETTEHSTNGINNLIGTSNVESQSTPYYVPNHHVQIQVSTPGETMVEQNQLFRSSFSETNMTNNVIITHADFIVPSWKDKPFLSQFPSVTFGRILNISLLLGVLCALLILILFQVLSNRTNTAITNEPSSQPSNTPTSLPLQYNWTNELLINIDVERPDENILMGYSVSLSGDGKVVVVGGYQTLLLYKYSEESNENQMWTKIIDLTDLNIVRDLSWNTVVSLSSDGHSVIVGDEFAHVIAEKSGAVMVFSNIFNDHIVQWYQVGSTISGDGHWHRFGGFVSIAENGQRIAASTSRFGRGYSAVYDYDGSEWQLKLKQSEKFFVSQAIAMSPNGALLARRHSFHTVVEMYELTTFTKIRFVDGIEIGDMGQQINIKGFAHSISFSYDSSILAIGSWVSSQVNMYRFNSQEKKYEPMGSSITIANVTGLGYSVSVSGDGKSLAVGAVSPPSEEHNDNGLSVFDDSYEWWQDRISERGRVYMFRMQNNIWEEVVEIEHDSTIYDKIGYSVSLSGDGKLLAFGAYGTGGAHGDGPHKTGQVGVYRSQPIL